MPCTDATHTHVWNTEGTLVIERCETICGFCNSHQKYGWHLRRHTRESCAKHKYPNLIVSEGWTSSPKGNRKPARERKRKMSTTPCETPSPPTAQLALPMAPQAIEPIRAAAPQAASQALNEQLSLPSEFMTFDLGGDLFMGGPQMDFTGGSIDPALLHEPMSDSTLPIESIDPSLLTVQLARVDAVTVEAVQPANQSASLDLCARLDEAIRGNGQLAASEVLHVLEQYTALFKAGLSM